MSDNSMTEEQMANLSDDDLMNMAIPPELDAGEEEPVIDEPEEDEEQPEETAEVDEDQTEEETSDDESDGVLAKGDDDLDDTGEPVSTKEPHSESSDDTGKKNKTPEKVNGDKPDIEGEKESKDAEASEKPLDYKAAYDLIMAPFKANGKEIKLNNPEEAVQLMQMGANYTKKLQALQPNLRLLKMLDNNNLLEEGKLSYLIDLDKRNPKAIQKLLKESGIDPLDIDTSVEPDYKTGNHRVSDEEMTFTTTLEEVTSNPEGKSFIVELNKTWDAKSKEALWTDPSILRVMTAQKESGIYDRISDEVDRRKTLGSIPNNVPFIQAYQTVGVEMQERGEFTPKTPAKVEEGNTSEKTSRVVATRPAKSKTVSNNERARAASATRSTSGKKAQEDFNPLALSDEEFEKSSQMASRL